MLFHPIGPLESKCLQFGSKSFGPVNTDLTKNRAHRAGSQSSTKLRSSNNYLFAGYKASPHPIDQLWFLMEKSVHDITAVADC
jgi:hypothetical protein